MSGVSRNSKFGSVRVRLAPNPTSIPNRTFLHSLSNVSTSQLDSPMSDAPIPISVPGSSSHARSSHPQGGKGKSRAGPSPSIKVAPDGTKIKKFRHRKTKEEVEFEKEGKRIAAGKVGEGGGVGVNKLKASLRQAKRLVVRVRCPPSPPPSLQKSFIM